MNITPKSILQIRHIYPELTGKSKDIADYILANLEDIIDHKVREVAKHCNCDDALIVRFCQRIGYSGFSEFKMSLAAEYFPAGIKLKELTHDDSFTRLKKNFLENNVRVFHDTVSLFKEDDINKAVEILSQAATIYIFAACASGIVATDLRMKLIRLGLNAVFDKDPEYSKMYLGLCTKHDAVVAISYTGVTENVCKMAAGAKAKDVPVISITNHPQSRLAGASDICLLTASDEKLLRLGAMTSRIAQYSIIDFLIINMALRNMERTEENIFKIYEMFKDRDGYGNGEFPVH